MGNKEIRWLVLSSGLNKLASTVATSGTVAFLLYGCLMGDYNGLFGTPQEEYTHKYETERIERNVKSVIIAHKATV